MSYHDYIFRFPADTPALDFGTLTAWMGLRDSRRIGTTVTVTAIPETGGHAARFEIWLYETRIACVGPDEVSFPGPDDPHMATTAWIAKVVRDNSVGTGAGRVRRRKADGPGPQMSRGRAGLLVIGWNRDMPVIGHAYPVDPLRIAADRQWAAEFHQRMLADRERYAAESARREALKTYTHPDFGPVYALGDRDLDHGYHFEVVDGSYFDTVGYVRDCRVGPGDSPYRASPEPGDEPVFTAFAGGPDHRSDALGAFRELAGALAAIAGRAMQDQRIGQEA